MTALVHLASVARASRARAALVLVGVACASGCLILERDDLVPAFGARCDVDKAACAVEHTCFLNDESDTQRGVCVPVQSYGTACDAPTWPPGRLADIKDGDVTITTNDQFPLIEDKRAVTGMLRVYREALGEQFTVPSLCGFRALQTVGNTFVLAKTNVPTFDGLQTLTSVHGGLAIFNNQQLENLDALAGLMEVTGGTWGAIPFQIVVANNPVLPAAAIAAFKDRLPAGIDVRSCGNQDDASCSATNTNALLSALARNQR